MNFKTVSTYQRVGVPPQLITVFFLFLIALVIAPYAGGVDFGGFKVPVLPFELKHKLKWIAPLLLAMATLLFIPIWKSNYVEDRKVDKTENEIVSPKSKYRLQSVPDIILNELQKRNINTDGIKIVSGFNINDLKKRIKILNSSLSDDEITLLVNSARETAFTTKYAAPKEDEKLEDVTNFNVEGISDWQIYLHHYLSTLGISEVSNIEVLDVGIGNAYASQIFLTKCASLTGIDISQSALTYAKDKLPNARLEIGSAENLENVKSFSIDLYVSFRTYQSTLFDVKESLHEAYRVLAIGGAIIISIPIMYLKKDDTGKIQNVLKGLIPQGASVPSFDYAMQVSERITVYMKILGFSCTEIYYDSPFEIYIGARK